MKGFEKMANDAGENESILLQNEANEVNEAKPVGEDSILLMHVHDILAEDGIKVDQFSSSDYTAYRFASIHGMSVYVRREKVHANFFQHRISIDDEDMKFAITSYDGDDVKSQIEAIYDKARNLCARKINIAHEARLRMARKNT